MPAAEAPSVFSHWSMQSGVGFLLAIPLVQTEMVILSEETQLVGVFSIFVALAYQGSSEYLSDLFDERKKTVRDARATPHALASLRSAALAFPFPHTLFPPLFPSPPSLIVVSRAARPISFSGRARRGCTWRASARGRAQVMAEHNALEQAAIDNVKEVIEAHKKRLGLQRFHSE